MSAITMDLTASTEIAPAMKKNSGTESATLCAMCLPAALTTGIAELTVQNHACLA